MFARVKVWHTMNAELKKAFDEDRSRRTVPIRQKAVKTFVFFYIFKILRAFLSRRSGWPKENIHQSRVGAKHVEY
jgi:hypothetical protein